MPLALVDSLLAFLQKTFPIILGGDRLFPRKCTTTRTQSWSKSRPKFSSSGLKYAFHSSKCTNFIMQILKPAFTILADHRSRSFLLVIRGTHSIKDTLTAATGAVVPFHHTVVHEGGVSNLVLGYAHCGMVAAARWIARLATPCLLKALSIYPEYKLKVLDI